MLNDYLQNVWPMSTCYGCGPANTGGLHIKSHWSDDGDAVIATYHAESKYNAGIPNVMYGGTVASLIDCHSIWTAIAFAYKAESRDIGSEPAIVYVTAELSVKYLKPTPLSEPLHLKAWVEGKIGRKTRVYCELGPKDNITATGDVVAARFG
ncbi:MAG: PaaI family thioesterase [Proteobacteria bacterium]|nr:PaaI family thioesterase [Pseudomonadota bacterium]